MAEHPLRERLVASAGARAVPERAGRRRRSRPAAPRASALDELGLEPSRGAARAGAGHPAAEPARSRRRPSRSRTSVPAEAAASGASSRCSRPRCPEDDDPEALRATLARVLEAATRGGRPRTAGTLERFGPEGLVAVFGAEGSREDDALRAVRAGVELHAAAGVAVGVATGEAVVAEEPRVTGAAVARAAGARADGRGRAARPAHATSSCASRSRSSRPARWRACSRVGRHGPTGGSTRRSSAGTRSSAAARGLRARHRRAPLRDGHGRRRAGHRQDAARPRAGRRLVDARCCSAAAPPTARAPRSCRSSRRCRASTPAARRGRARGGGASTELAGAAERAGLARRVVLGGAAGARGAGARAARSCCCSTTCTGPSRRCSTWSSTCATA